MKEQRKKRSLKIRSLAWMMAVAMVLTLVPVNVYAADDSEIIEESENTPGGGILIPPVVI